ncbi:Signal transduction histidine kinase, nitrogen specific [Anopheles sinensis]|uniref:Signal transduction histidine kinase, nitrogen specific n=1 Tax=Anopheles sinensis TaxID=74873 RepID=A0A084W341_ANOSI|nr:Signal transduction histidine kinase, nitrogen specific [Anopheles sinensis]
MGPVSMAPQRSFPPGRPKSVRSKKSVTCVTGERARLSGTLNQLRTTTGCANATERFVRSAWLNQRPRLSLTERSPEQFGAGHRAQMVPKSGKLDPSRGLPFGPTRSGEASGTKQSIRRRSVAIEPPGRG